MSITAVRLRKLREEYGLSVANVAERTGLSETSLYHYESGEFMPRADALMALCAVYQCSADYLLGRTDVRAMYHDNLVREADLSGGEIAALVRAAKEGGRLRRQMRFFIVSCEAIMGRLSGMQRAAEDTVSYIASMIED